MTNEAKGPGCMSVAESMGYADTVGMAHLMRRLRSSTESAALGGSGKDHTDRHASMLWICGGIIRLGTHINMQRKAVTLSANLVTFLQLQQPLHQSWLDL